MMTVSKLSEFLVQHAAAIATFDIDALRDHKVNMHSGYNIFNETYGKESMIYVGSPTEEIRRTLERELIKLKQKVNVNYHPGSRILEVQVRYFRGWHWDE